MPSSLPTDSFLNKVRDLLPAGHQIQGSRAFFWSPRTATVHADLAKLNTSDGRLALLHEISHALLGHHSYDTDIELLRLEVAAWHTAAELAQTLDVPTDQNHIEDCLDTYREWQYARSSCPSCTVCGVQTVNNQYECITCGAVWRVSSSRFCRVYRMEQRHNKKAPPQRTETVFS